jgi:tetratricopeptide (TPR) repeat protein
MFDPSDPRNELYSRPRHFKVFISSKMADGALRAERAAAIDAVEAFPLARPWAWEKDAPAGSYYSEEECIRQAGTSDAIVLILEDELTPTTRKEYAAAHAAGTTAIILLRSGVDRDPGLEKFIRRARREAITKSFSSLSELRSAITDSLWTWTVRAGRTALVRNREERGRAGGDAAYGDLELTDSTGESRYVADLVEEARDAVDEGSPEEALELLYFLADSTTTAGLFRVARALLDDLAEIVPADQIDQDTQAWILNVRGRVEGALRNPRMALASFEQMRQIGVAIGSKDLEATAHQNLGVEAVMRSDHDSAREHFLDSLRLKRELGDTFGGIQVLLNMVNVLMGQEELDEAERLLDDLEPLVLDGRLSGLRASVHGQRGLLASRRGDYDSAKELFLKSLRSARQVGSVPRQITALQNLGSNAAERGKGRESVRWYEKSLALARSGDDRHQEQIQRIALGRALAGLEQWPRAAEQFAAAGSLAADLGDSGAHAEALGDAAGCLRNAGEAEAALTLINEVLADPEAERDAEWRTVQLTNLAEVLVDLEQPGEALKRLEEAANLAPNPGREDVALWRAAEIALDHPGLAGRAPGLLHRALDIKKVLGTSTEWAWEAATMGAILNGTSQSAEAPAFFSLALRVFARSGDRRRAYFTRNDRAIALGSVGDLAAAADDLQACLGIARALKDRPLRFQALMNLGEIERQRGRLPDGDKHLSAALKLARALEDPRDEGAVLSILGLLRSDQDRTDDAAEAYLGALAIGRELRDAEIQASATGGLGGIALRAGRFAEAERRYRQAIRHHGSLPSAGLAEDLGGCMLSMAPRGKVDEEIVQRLVDVSGVLGWDRHCARELCAAAASLAEAGGDPDGAVDLQAASIGCALRDVFLHFEEDGPASAPQIRVLSDVIFRGIAWMCGRDDYAERKTALISGVSDFLGLDGDLDLVSEPIATAEEILQAQAAEEDGAPRTSEARRAIL